MAQVEDIAPGLLKKIDSDFTGAIEKANLKKAKNYAQAYWHAERVGKALTGAFGKEITSDILPDGMMYYNIANRVVRPMLKKAYGMVANSSRQAQDAINQKSGIGLKAIASDLDDDRVQGFCDTLSADTFENKSWVLDEPVKTLMRSAVDDTIETNADFQSRAGVSAYIEREAEAGACAWCQELAGRYSYPYGVPDDIFRRHDNCRCQVNYHVEGQMQNVWSKKWYTEQGKAVRAEKAEELKPRMYDDMDRTQLEKLKSDYESRISSNKAQLSGHGSNSAELRAENSKLGGLVSGINRELIRRSRG